MVFCYLGGDFFLEKRYEIYFLFYLIFLLMVWVKFEKGWLFNLYMIKFEEINCMEDLEFDCMSRLEYKLKL